MVKSAKNSDNNFETKSLQKIKVGWRWADVIAAQSSHQSVDKEKREYTDYSGWRYNIFSLLYEKQKFEVYCDLFYMHGKTGDGQRFPQELIDMHEAECFPFENILFRFIVLVIIFVLLPVVAFIIMV